MVAEPWATSAAGRAGLSPSYRPLPEKSQQFPIVRNRGRDVQMIDPGGAKPALVQLITRRGTPCHVGVAQIDEPRHTALDVDNLRQPALGKPFLARIADGDRNDVVSSIQAPHRPLEVLIEKVADDDHDRTAGADLPGVA